VTEKEDWNSCEICERRYPILSIFQKVAEELNNRKIAYILAERYGFDLFSRSLIGEKKSLREIEKEWGIPESTIRLWEKSALELISRKYSQELKK
jgi:DNA-directed RNA polymerase sigma subunit (sigma70/sigma32)